MSACVFLFLICVSSLGVSHVRSNGDQVAKACDDPPVFSPSHLVVRHGDPTSATCTVCQEKCRNKLMGLEKALGTASTNGTTITWTVDKMTEWDTSALCFYNAGFHQCSTSLPITVYQPPAKVSLSFVNHSGPMILGHSYTMECLVEDVAPVGGLTVVFYKGETQLGQIKLDAKERKPVTMAVPFEYRPGREFHNWNYYCEAILDLGTERYSWKSKGDVNVDTYFPPVVDVPPHPDHYTVSEGDALLLNCSAYGNPPTHYLWTLPSGQTIAGSSVFTLVSVTVSDAGYYTCFANNSLGNDTVNYSVFVMNDWICDDLPVFSPSHLVVRHGDPTSATCTVCQEKCHNKFMGLEKALGTASTNGTTITWTVDNMTEWHTSATCFYDAGSEQCSTSLPITVYQPPAKVSLSFVNHSGPMILGHSYTMECLVEDVAPVGGLTVVFYKGETQLGQIKLDGNERKPVTKAVPFEYRPGREFHDWNYYCEAILDLGTERYSWTSKRIRNVDSYGVMTTTATTTQRVLDITGVIGTTRSTRNTGSTSRTPVHRFTLGFMILFLALV